MQLYTIQLAQWRLAKAKGLEVVDITLRHNSPFAPTPYLLGKYKKDHNIAEYMAGYRQHLKDTYLDTYTKWLALCQHEAVAIGCFCGSDCFCHRFPMVGFIERQCANFKLDFEYKGELTKDGLITPKYLNPDTWI